MAKGLYIGNENAKKVKKIYLGNGTSRKVKKGYIGVGNIAKLFYSSGYVWKKYTTVQQQAARDNIVASNVILDFWSDYDHLYELSSASPTLSGYHVGTNSNYVDGHGNGYGTASNPIGKSFGANNVYSTTDWDEGPRYTIRYTAQAESYASYKIYVSSIIDTAYNGRHMRGNIYTFVETTVDAAGTYLGTVESENRSAYPSNGKHSDGYWYVYQGEA